MYDPCDTCIEAADHPHFRFPTHLVHPELGKPMLFDKHGLAVCPDCGAGWYRGYDNEPILLRA